MTTQFRSKNGGALHLLYVSAGEKDYVVVPNGKEITNQTVIVGPLNSGDSSRIYVTDSPGGTLVQKIKKDRTPDGGIAAELRRINDKFTHEEITAIRV